MTPISATAQPTILLVSDDVRLRRTLGAFLRDAGHVVTPVASGERALAAARRSTPSVVVIDACLAGMSCYELAERLPETAILVITPEEGSGPAIQSDMVNAAGVLGWPCTPEELESRVAEIVSPEARSRTSAAQTAGRSNTYFRTQAWA